MHRGQSSPLGWNLSSWRFKKPLPEYRRLTFSKASCQPSRYPSCTPQGCFRCCSPSMPATPATVLATPPFGSTNAWEDGSLRKGHYLQNKCLTSLTTFARSRLQRTMDSRWMTKPLLNTIYREGARFLEGRRNPTTFSNSLESK